MVLSPLFLNRPYVDVAYYNMGFGSALEQLTACVVWIPLQVTSLLVYPLFKVRSLGLAY